MKRTSRILLLALGLLLIAGQALADSSMIYEKDVNGKMNTVYQEVYTGLENNGYYVLYEPNIGRNLANFKQRWGNDYNKNKLESIRSMIFCNAWYANKISNADPQMLALCPLHISLIYKDGVTRILFIRPSLIATDSPAEKIALELEQDVIRTIESSIQ